MDLRRGDIVVLVAAGDFGKPRPAVVVQTDMLNATQDTLIVCLLTSDLRDAPAFRIMVEPDPGNGLRESSQIMIDKIVAVSRARIRRRIGALRPKQVAALDASLRLVLDLV